VVARTLVSINEFNLRRARLVLEWVTESGFNSRCGTFISVSNQPPMSTQPGHSFVSRRQRVAMPRGWGVKVWFVCGLQVKLCDPFVAHKPYMSALVHLLTFTLLKTSSKIGVRFSDWVLNREFSPILVLSD